MALYYRDAGAHREAAGLALVPKLKYEHIYLTSFSKMRVDQVANINNYYNIVKILIDYYCHGIIIIIAYIYM